MKNISSSSSLWRNRLARSAVNRKVGGSNPPRDDRFESLFYLENTPVLISTEPEEPF